MPNRISSDGFALVNTDYVMVDASITPPPKNVELICGNIHSGKSMYSIWDDAYGFTHWAGLPVFPKTKKETQ